MTVLEPGSGMGFFTLDLANLVGASGRIIAIDIQARMLERLKSRAAKAGLLDRIDVRLASPPLRPASIWSIAPPSAVARPHC